MNKSGSRTLFLPPLKNIKVIFYILLLLYFTIRKFKL